MYFSTHNVFIKYLKLLINKLFEQKLGCIIFIYLYPVQPQHTVIYHLEKMLWLVGAPVRVLE